MERAVLLESTDFKERVKSMTISSLMRSRAVLDAQISETPISIEKPHAAKWAVEERILSYRATTLGALRKQLRVLADRARDGIDVARDLERLVRP
jgi:hypothetical protein